MHPVVKTFFSVMFGGLFTIMWLYWIGDLPRTAAAQAAPAKPTVEPAPDWIREFCYKGRVYVTTGSTNGGITPKISSTPGSVYESC